MRASKIDDQFSVTGQITPEQIPEISAAGFRAIVCARPDREEGGQPSFNAVAREAEKHGLQIVHVPVSGVLGSEQITRFRQAMEQLPRPVLGYCRSGARAGNLYATLQN
ncbi:MAG TPA: TIGR01244 family sulfur transferase [Devosia sp.]|uniref:TIGR01244 family sulfur transferase n=1 Tax=Devosia sp. TaxID=1871048 RepID=UPI002DDD8F1D|nr:TIGR01244 family sulfur transferase [Devosia sp.]HEV2518411.1 TIGR01244 family sulfur transferase [Devosia sp.]